MIMSISPFPSDTLLLRFTQIKPVTGINSILAHQAEDVYSLWEAWENERGSEADIPFWAVAWPASIGIANYILQNDWVVKGKKVLDIGCGAGIGSIAAKKAGAELVTANDIDPVALYMTEKNSHLNNTHLCLEPSNLLLQYPTAIVADTILVADMFYTLNQASQLEQYLKKQRLSGAAVLISDGGRNFAPRSGVSLLATYEMHVNLDLEGRESRTVRVLSLD